MNKYSKQKINSIRIELTGAEMSVANAGTSQFGEPTLAILYQAHHIRAYSIYGHKKRARFCYSQNSGTYEH